jgi:6-phosphogluconolactonase
MAIQGAVRLGNGSFLHCLLEKWFVAIVIGALLITPASAMTWRAYIGTYGKDPSGRPPDSHGEGIYLADLDSATGVLSNLRLAATALSPTWLAISPNGRFLYANSETASGPDGAGTITAYAVNPMTGALTALNTVSSCGAGPVYISLHPSGKFVMVSNYAGGSFAVFRLKPDGSIGALTDLYKPTGPLNPPTAADTPSGQFAVSDHRGSKGHMIGADPTGRYVIGDDAGRDLIFVWTLDTDTGKLTLVSKTAATPGSAPRHFVFSPDGKTLYQLQEQDSRLSTYNFADGTLLPEGSSISGLPEGYAGSNTASEILIDKPGQHLYFANRLQDSIAVFTISADGTPAYIANIHAEADLPRSLTLDPSGRFLYSLNQKGDNVATFAISHESGLLRFTGQYFPVASPTMMLVVPGR